MVICIFLIIKFLDRIIKEEIFFVYKNIIVYDKIMSVLVVWWIYDIYWVMVCYFLVCDKIFGRCF